MPLQLKILDFLASISRKRFVYVDTHCTEEVLSIAEATIMKAKAMDKDVPITIIWDSVAASSPKAELVGDYDKETIGLQARAISKGMRKITGVIANQNVLVCDTKPDTNQDWSHVWRSDHNARGEGNSISFVCAN